MSDSARAATILARHVAAIGGEETIRAIRYRHTAMTLILPVGGASRIESWVMHPNHVYIDSGDEVSSGWNGSVAWSISPHTGPVVHPTVPMHIRQSANFLAPLQLGASLTDGGSTERHGRTLDVVHAVRDGNRFTMYFDRTSGLMAAMDLAFPPPPAGDFSTTLEEYRDFDGVLHPTRTVMRGLGTETVAQVLSLSHAPFDSSVFAVPARIAKLIAKRGG